MLNTLPPSEALACAICGNRHDNWIHHAREMMFGLQRKGGTWRRLQDL